VEQSKRHLQFFVSHILGKQNISGWWLQHIFLSLGILIPNIWKVIKAMFQTTNQIVFFMGKHGEDIEKTHP
jgi:hypothetical protein